MSKESLEHISSLMDGELSRETGLFLTRRLSSDEEMSGVWERYHLIRDCIRQPGGKHVCTGLNEKIIESIQAEDVPAAPASRTARWLKPVTGLAIAASVALMAIVVTTPQTISPGSDENSPTTAGNQPFVSPNTLSITPATQAASYAPTNTNRLNAYLLRHNQMARTAGRQGFVSFVPIVATPVSSEVEAAEENPGVADAGSEQKVSENQ